MQRISTCALLLPRDHRLSLFVVEIVDFSLFSIRGSEIVFGSKE